MTATIDLTGEPDPDQAAGAPALESSANDAAGLWRFLRTDRRAVIALGGASFTLLAISTALAWNLSYAADEGSHYAMVHFQARNLGLADWRLFEYGALRGHLYNLYSPVPYLPYLPFDWLSSVVGPFPGAGKPPYFIVRLGGLVVALAQFAVVLALVRRMIRRATPLQVVAVAFAVNLLPQLRYLHATINSDGMTILVATLGFAVALRLLQRPAVTTGDAALVGATLGAGAHMRYNSFIALSVLVVVFGVLVFLRPSTWHAKLRFLGLAVAIPLLVAAPFHLRVMSELGDGHVLASSDHEALRSSTFDGVVSVMPPVGKRLQIAGNAAGDIWAGMWAWYPRFFELRGILRLVLVLLVATGIAGLLLSRGRVLGRTGQGIALGAIGAVGATWALMALTWPYGSQGRFLLPAGVTAFAGVLLGTAALLVRMGRVPHSIFVASGCWSILLLFVNVMALASVR